MTEKNTMVKYSLIDYLGYEKKEAWLNKLARQGWTLKKAGYFRYEFEKTEPSEYIIRLQVLDGKPTKPMVADYLALQESTGAELISVVSDIAYFRRKASLGSFEIFSDRASKISYLGRLMRQRALSAGLFLFIALQNLYLLLTRWSR